MTVWDRLGWFKERLPVRHNLDGFKQYNFTNCNVTLRKYVNKPLVVHLLLQRYIKVKLKIYISKVVLHGAVEVCVRNLFILFISTNVFILPYIQLPHPNPSKNKNVQKRQLYNILYKFK